MELSVRSPPPIRRHPYHLASVRPEKTKIPKLQQASAAVMVPARPSFDLDDKGYCRPSHSLTSNGRQILKEITKRTPETGHVMEFHGVTPREYYVLQNVLEETGRKLRLSYDSNERVLLVDMPSAIHEAPFTKLKDSLASTLQSLPYDHKLICSAVNMNLALEIEGASVMPDISIALMKSAHAQRPVAHALDKMKKTIRAHPEVTMAILAVVREAKVYESPKEGSVASATLLTSQRPMPRSEFIAEEFPPCEPVEIAGHTWCHLSSVEYMVWVKPDDAAQLDLDDEDEQYMARGALFPAFRMGAVMNMIQRGLEKVRDAFAAYSEHLDETVDVTRLEEAEVVFSIDWDDTITLMHDAVLSTSYARYKHWHEDAQLKDEPVQITTTGKRIRDPSYSPSESSASDDADLQETSTRLSRGRPKRKQCPTSQPPPHKSKLTGEKHRD
ncbi:uncharacterized protein HD556DRAFT_1441954 [Suillus plorans]|uniref:Uncharacterized protein n=1 Tax=Suillus plorans TaxID=116603 RepID=A0A9P7DJI1_9AGAM|nr:uncharacterized protein HD556DRAFT_1441954 [Suillus plorans]KAG1795618.1 hypothetical protein HD556DRAFT_1441954 [Suillus plorans]